MSRLGRGPFGQFGGHALISLALLLLLALVLVGWLAGVR